jgi:hypothetical protein
MHVLLESLTTGYVDKALIGETVTVLFKNENGMPTTETGVVIEIL